MSGSAFGVDRGGVEKRCVCCGSPTKSHPAPNGYLCHSCVTERDEAEIFESLPTGVYPDLSGDSTVSCRECDSIHTLREAADETGNRTFIRVIFDRVPLDRFTAVVVVGCPRCTKATEYLTDKDGAETVAETTGAQRYVWSPRRGVVEQ